MKLGEFGECKIWAVLESAANEDNQQTAICCACREEPKSCPRTQCTCVQQGRGRAQSMQASNHLSTSGAVSVVSELPTPPVWDAAPRHRGRWSRRVLWQWRLEAAVFWHQEEELHSLEQTLSSYYYFECYLMLRVVTVISNIILFLIYF